MAAGPRWSPAARTGGGGLIVPARDLALIGQLFLDRGTHAGTRLLSAEWVDQSWAPCPVKREYGYLWWLNDDRRRGPGPRRPAAAPGATADDTCCGSTRPGSCLASHWTEEPLHLIRQVSRTVTSPPVDRS